MIGFAILGATAAAYLPYRAARRVVAANMP
jgi:hypothetical protein